MTEYTKLIELVVNESTRIIAIPNDNIVLGVVGDIEVNKLMFKMPRYYCGFDMSEFTPKINYVTPNAEGNYYKSELEVTDDVITFTWLLTSDVTEYNGTVKFSISLYKKENGRVLKAFNSRSSVGNVLEGLNVDTYVTPEQQQTILDRLETEIREDIQSFVTEKSDAAIKAIDTKKNDVLSTIAEDQYIQKIEQNTANVTSLKEEKADKTTLAVTERKLDALWKLNQGVSYQFEEDSETAYQKTVPTGAKLAAVKKIGGKTIVWNQLIKSDENEKEMTCTDADDYVSYRADFDVPVVGRKYLVSFECYMERTDVSFLLGLGNYFASVKLNNISNAWTKISRIVTVTSIEIPHKFFYIYFNAVPRTMEVGDSVKVRNVEVFDLTKMFGSGNEPATVEEFEAMFPGEGYSYNAGELLSAGVNEIVERGRNLIDAKKVVSKKGDVTFENLGNGKIHVYGSTDTRPEIDEIYADEKDFPVGRYRINNTGNSGISITFVKKK